jgi:hypothetical protein
VRRSRRPIETQNVNPISDADCVERAITPQRARNAGNAALRAVTRSVLRRQYHPLAGCELSQDLSLGHARFVWCGHSSSPPQQKSLPFLISCGALRNCRGDASTGATTCHAMSLFPDQPPSPSPPAKPKLSAEERRIRQEDRLKTIRLRMAIGRELDDCGITTPAEIGTALGMPTAETTKLLTRHQWREGDA